MTTFEAWLDEEVDGVVFFTYGNMNNPKYLTSEEREKNIAQIADISQEYYEK